MFPPGVVAPHGIIQPFGNSTEEHKHQRFPTAKILSADPRDANNPNNKVTILRNSYKSTHLAEEIRSVCTLRPPNLTKMQGQALEVYHAYPDYRLDTFSTFENHTVEKLGVTLGLYAHLFDALFFANSLLHSGRLDTKISRKKADETHLYGFLSDHPTKPKHKQITLYMHNNSREQPLVVVNKMLGTLAHEMVHAMISLYCCSACQNDKSFEMMGQTWHGRAFLDIASQVEASIKSRRLLGLDVDIAVLYQVASEVNKCAMPIPEDKWLRSWGVTRRQVEGELQEIRASSGDNNADESIDSVLRGLTICVTVFKT